MAKLFSTIGAWVKAHVIASVAIGVGSVAAITTAIVVPVAVSNSGVTVTWLNEDGTELEVDKKVKKGTLPTYDGATPTKAGDAQFSYTFKGWDNEVVEVGKEDVTYKATYTQTVNKYKVTWKDYDGSELEVDQEVEYGATPAFNGATPERDMDAQYTYTFDGWNEEIQPVTGNASYTAKYSKVVNKYTVTWKNYDGTVLETDENVEYGTLPSYDGEDPKRAKTAETTYNWNLWDKEVVAVTGDVTYTAHFDTSKTKYSVKFLNWDDSEIKVVKNVDYDTPVGEVFDGEAPTRDDTYVNYDFDSWEELERDEVNYIRTAKAKLIPVSTKENYLNFSLIKDNTEYQVSSNYFAGDYLFIPSEHEGKPVTTIGYNGFYNIETIKHVYIPDSVTSISQYAFYSGDYIEDITIDGSPAIEYCAFGYLGRLKTLKIKGGSAYSVGNSLLSSSGTYLPTGEGFSIEFGEGLAEVSTNMCEYSRVKSVKLPASITRIREQAFYSCTLLESVEFAEGSKLTKIDSTAFYRCEKLNNIELVDGLTEIGRNAFSSTGLTSVVIPDTVTSLGNYAFAYCYSLDEVTLGKFAKGYDLYGGQVFKQSLVKEYKVSAENNTLKAIDGVVYSINEKDLIAYPIGNEASEFTCPDSVETIEEFAFAYSANLETVTISDAVTILNPYTFAYTSKLATVNLPDALTTISSYTFYNSHISSITLGNNVSSIYSSAFGGSAISEIIFDSNPYFSFESGVLYNAAKTRLILIAGTKSGDFVLPTSVTNIEAYAFYGSTNLDSITFGDEVTVVGEYAFAYSTAEVNMGAGFTKIPNHAFSYYKRSSLTLPSSVTTLGNYAFDHSEITSIALPDACKTINDSAFSNCEKLESVNLNKVETIGTYAFYYCQKLGDLVIPSTCTKVSYYAFAYDESIVNLEVGAKELESDCFDYCYGLKSVVLKDTCEVLGNYSFYFCTALEDITFSNNLTKIGERCFYSDEKLKDFTLPDTLTTIGSYAFYQCKALTEVTIPDGIEILDYSTFYNCSNLETIYLPSSITEIRSSCFYNIKATSMNYDGTKEDFGSIVLGSYWTYTITSVVCTDGPLDL